MANLGNWIAISQRNFATNCIGPLNRMKSDRVRVKHKARGKAKGKKIKMEIKA